MKYIDNQLKIAVMNSANKLTRNGEAVTETNILTELKDTGIRDNWEDYMAGATGSKGDFKIRILFVIKRFRDTGVFKWCEKKSDGYADNLYDIDMHLFHNHFSTSISKLFKAATPADDDSGEYVYSCETDDGTILDGNFFPILSVAHMRKVKNFADTFNIYYPFNY